jgi:hypothetical protein
MSDCGYVDILSTFPCSAWSTKLGWFRLGLAHLSDGWISLSIGRSRHASICSTEICDWQEEKAQAPSRERRRETRDEDCVDPLRADCFNIPTINLNAALCRMPAAQNVQLQHN